jgi:hypothetical protein
VDQLAGTFAFVALVAVAGGSDPVAGQRIAVGQSGHVVAAQDPPASSWWYSGLAGQPRRAATQPSSGGDYPPLDSDRSAGRAVMRAAGPVEQTGLALGLEPGHPAVRALPGHTQFLGHMGDRAAFDTYPMDEQPAAVHGQPGITVGHEDLQVVSEAANSTSPGGPPQINYLAGVSPTSRSGTPRP